MLARRFTIVCLLVMLFAVFFARIVAETGNQPRLYQAAMGRPCAVGTLICTAGLMPVAARF
jgi:hypothetical protein